jgi:hypothetical protein
MSVKQTWLQKPSTLLSIGTPCIVLAKPVKMNRTFVFHPFLETTLSNGQFGLFKSQLTVSECKSGVIPLGVKLKVAILSIH